MTALLADMAGPMYVVLGVMALAGVFGAISIVWFGLWLVRRLKRKPEPVSEDGP